ncbi:hypothetical protein DM01DRAFT_1370399 [Hesseltinella vesiculosa]|uniref:Uncharacterized protein n=1 Tax=Hesseltinella vesiculosa TaxID=101127 RepID=A0A1X2GUX6_9FUNG|nr:hypothetical protein DM01DRAFT_1370399 [Hesseltinella vesiculosa]
MGRDKVEKALVQGELYQGRLRINANEAFVCNARTGNRALEGDLVAIQLLDVNQVWKQCTDRDVRHREKQQQDHNHEPATASDNNDDNNEAADNRSFSGTLCTERPGAKSVQSVNGRISTYWFKPMNKRVPLIMIKPEDLPGELITDLSSYRVDTCFFWSR